MHSTGLTTRICLATLALICLIWAAPARSQSQPAMPQPDRDADLTRQQLAAFDQFLDNHPEVAQQLRSNPSLINNQEFVENHPELQTYLQQHPEVREDLNQNPNAVMHQEERYDRREDRDQNHDRDRDGDITHRELVNMDQFMDSHPEIAEQLRKDPSLVDNKQFVESHPALQQFLAQHPELREQYKENPNTFMHREDRYDRREDARALPVELANMDQFMDKHPEIAEQLRKNPTLIDNKQFVEGHPALQQFMEQHPELRAQYQENPNAFMHQEERFDRREDGVTGRDRDVTAGELSSFHGFLEGHGNIASELSKNPSLATNQEYLENHTALKTYLNSHPEVNEELSENPQSFVKSAATFDGTKDSMMKGSATKLPATGPKDPK